ncbi:MAG: hypothetical protein M1457_04630 [bacterium]|nr:hypothetical protein [bacterium]
MRDIVWLGVCPNLFREVDGSDTYGAGVAAGAAGAAGASVGAAAGAAGASVAAAAGAAGASVAAAAGVSVGAGTASSAGFWQPWVPKKHAEAIPAIANSFNAFISTLLFNGHSFAGIMLSRQVIFSKTKNQRN